MTAIHGMREGDWLGEYEIRARLRSGGMATLLLAQRHGAAGVSRPVVIKVIHPHLAEDEQMVRMFIDEARISSHIRHSNVVYVEEFGEYNGTYYIVMEYVDGCSVHQLLRMCVAEGRKLSADLAGHIAVEAAAGLHAAHQTTGEDGAPLGIVHRDVSPSNVLLTRDGRVKVIDFGIAKARGRLGATRAGSGLKGKLCYMPPEQAWGRPIDRRADIYALGVCLWELLTCRRLFRGNHDLALLELVRNPVIPPPSKLNPKISAALDAVVLRATAPRPEDRHQSALELRRDLMNAVPAALALPPELIGEIVRYVCAPERAQAIELGTSTFDDPPEPASPPADASVPATQPRPHAWRNRGLVFAGVIGLCAIALALAGAGRSEHAGRPDAASAALLPPQAVRVIDAGVAAASDAPGADPIAVPTGTSTAAASAPPAAPTETSTAAANAPAAAAAAPAETAPPTRAPPRRPRATPPPGEDGVTSVEAGGAILANEPAPRRPAKPAPRPNNAVQVDDAVLAR